jgi:pyridoxal phosphate enzyme (YggS family)
MPFSDLPGRVAEIRAKIDAARSRGGHGQVVRIVAVTKTHGPDAVLAALAAGISDIGENKVQEATGKQDALAGMAAMTGGMPAISASARPVTPSWHLIGHLQRNKVKFLDRFSVFHAVDSMRLAEAIDEFGQKQGKPIDVLVEANVSGEESKGGFGLRELEEVSALLAGKRGMRVIGVMTMAPFEAREKELRSVFAGAREARRLLTEAGLPANELSMGMSGDFEIAVEEGATMVRLGTVLFGERGTSTP